MLVWTDVETTGLDERTGSLLEVALVVTNDNLDEIAATSRVIQPAGCMWANLMNPFVASMHHENGLIKDVNEKGQPVVEVGACLYDWLIDAVAVYAGSEHHVDAGGLEPHEILKKNTPLAGSTVSFDRRWLRQFLPEIEDLFHYRSIDVSSITELAHRWAPTVYAERPKSGKAHRALADARESISYLSYYRRVGFVGGVK